MAIDQEGAIRPVRKRNPPDLVEQIREAIIKSGQSLSELSRLTGVHVSRISRFVRGERSIDVAAASAICQVLGYGLAKLGQGKVE
jgi:transcriptional regulator with XRE-family HTH domain